jgi:amino acid adenylation domain-containing protein
VFEEFPAEDLDQSLGARFEEMVRRYPHRIAVRMGGQAITYAELNGLANRLARLLLRKGGSSPEPVALFFKNGIPLMAATLAVLKAGKFFVLLDTVLPKERIAATLADSRAQLLLTDEENPELSLIAAGHGCSVIYSDLIDAATSAEDLGLSIAASAPAYIIYTSGSTGGPKGVMKNHQNQLHSVMLRTNANHICVHDRIALLPSGTANAVANTFLALLNGAELLPFDVKNQGIPALVAWLCAERITVCQIATPLFRRLCDHLTGEEDFSALRILRMRSESVQTADFLLYREHFPSSCLFLNGLSASETGVFTEYLMDCQSVVSGPDIPVGYPMEEMEVLLLDDDGRDVGDSQIGEIVVRSRYLASGYWRNAELTAKKFRADAGDPGKRLYYTGDLGLRLPDGCLLYKGRKDFRVKIRGYGVEVGEVEKTLQNHPGIREAVVVARSSGSGESQLVAYFVSTGEPAPSVSALRGYLQAKLPEYMIPAAFVRLDALPLTTNGKVNRSSLPPPETFRPDLDTAYVGPRTDTEEALATVWAQVLCVERSGIDDNFFDLGGDSLAATRVISQIIKQFHVEIPIQRFFEFPTVAALARYIETAPQGKPAKKDLSIERAMRGEKLCLSFAQERLWFLDQLEAGGYGYNLLAVYRLKGKLNLRALEQSVNEVVKRHEVLRTVFASTDGEPEQIVLAAMGIKIPSLDLRGIVSQHDRDSEIRRLCKEEARRSFDLARGPLLRITLLQLSAEEYLLLRAMHHIVIDGWSGAIFFRELAHFYKAFAQNQPPLLPPLPIQYADFAAWQRQWFRGAVEAGHLAYWKKTLADVARLELATDRPRPPAQTFRGAHEGFKLSETLSAELKALSHRYGVTLFMLLLAAFQTLLGRYTGQKDIIIGSPVAGRTRGEIEALIGFFLNMLPLRADLSGNPSFRELLHRTRALCLAALAHQDFPFEKLIEELRTERDPSYHPLFQVTFGFRNTPRFSITLAGLEAEELEVDSGIARFDINLFMEEEESHLRGYLNYNTDLFNAETIKGMIDHFTNLLESIVRDPGQRIGQLPLLSEAERHRLLIDWNRTAKDYPAEKCIHQLFEEQARKTPQATALVFGGQEFTYRRLNQIANQLAHYLRKQGVGPEVLVGICLERSAQMVIGLLGILKAGGAYVPLEAHYPRERLAFVIAQTQPAVVLTELALLPDFADLKTRTLCMDRAWDSIGQEQDTDPATFVTPENLAYVIYTSGSSGQPKGVQIQHRSVVNLLKSTEQRPGISDLDNLLAITSLSFDIAALELFLPLTVGGRVTLAASEVAADGRKLAELLSASGTTVMQATPSTWRMLLEAGWDGRSGLKAVSGGEALIQPLSHELLRKSAALWNLYGPTETTIWSTCGELSAETERSLLGRPIDNTQTYILDKSRQPVPIAVPGEIYIGGVGLARGYLHRPDLTAERFIPHPFSAEPGARLYRTGDLARYLPDGNIEFLGRIDQQIKLRGFRVELGEIESVLAQHPAIDQAVVMARADENPKSEIQNSKSSPLMPEKRLVAYVVARRNGTTSAAELRDFLKRKLPAYMLPAGFMFLDACPLTPGGKIDRQALPAPEQRRPESERGDVAPPTAPEQALAAIWAELLKRDGVGTRDDFFDLGGHSLLATQLVSRIRERFDVELPLRLVFEKRTVAELSAEIELAALKPAENQSGLEIPLATEHPRAVTTGESSALQWQGGMTHGASNLSEYRSPPELLIIHDPTEFGAFDRCSRSMSAAELLENYLFRERPDLQELHQQHLRLASELRKRARVAYLSEILGRSYLESNKRQLAINPNYMFTHDALITLPWVPDGCILARMQKPIRASEPAVWKNAAQVLGLRELVAIPPPLFLEGGDVMPLCYQGKKACLIGFGPRTSKATLFFLRDTLVRERILDEIIGFELAEWRLNLDGCFFVISEDTVVAHPESVKGGVLLSGNRTEPIQPLEYFRGHGFNIIEASREESFFQQACNFACLGSGTFIAYNMTERINNILRAHGSEIISFPGTELVKGNGGPHCMTRPIYRRI